VLDVDHLAERDHGHPELGLVLADEFLGVVWPVERPTLGVGAWPGVIASHDEVGDPVVAPDDGVQRGLAGSPHAHGERQQRQHRRVVGVAIHDRLVAANPRVVVDVTRLGHADDGMDEEVGLHLLGRAQGELVVGAVQRVTGLEGDHPAPAPSGELGPQRRRRVAQRRVVVVGWQLDALEGAG
jgi:hypothetical protein